MGCQAVAAENMASAEWMGIMCRADGVEGVVDIRVGMAGPVR